MKDKKGFTLVEILCVIVLLALITLMATSGIMSLTKKSKENLYCAKIKLIESNAREYAVRLESELNNSTEMYNGNKSLKIKVSDLIESGKLEPDKNDIVLNPLDDSSMNDTEIILYLKNNQIYAVIPNSIC